MANSVSVRAAGQSGLLQTFAPGSRSFAKVPQATLSSCSNRAAGSPSQPLMLGGSEGAEIALLPSGKSPGSKISLLAAVGMESLFDWFARNRSRGMYTGFCEETAARISSWRCARRRAARLRRSWRVGCMPRVWHTPTLMQSTAQAGSLVVVGQAVEHRQNGWDV